MLWRELGAGLRPRVDVIDVAWNRGQGLIVALDYFYNQIKGTNDKSRYNLDSGFSLNLKRMFDIRARLLRFLAINI